jgi:hypothetical protein
MCCVAVPLEEKENKTQLNSVAGSKRSVPGSGARHSFISRTVQLRAQPFDEDLWGWKSPLTAIYGSVVL